MNRIFEKYVLMYSDTHWPSVDPQERFTLSELTKSLEILSNTKPPQALIEKLSQLSTTLKDHRDDQWRFYFYTSCLQDKPNELQTVNQNQQAEKLQQSLFPSELYKLLTNEEEIQHFLNSKPLNPESQICTKQLSDKTVGLITTCPISAHTLIGEYTGHVRKINELFQEEPDLNQDRAFILWLADINLCIDSRKIGNLSRYIRRSCRPNATIKPFLVDGQLRVPVYSLYDIPENSELTLYFDYPWREYRYILSNLTINF